MSLWVPTKAGETCVCAGAQAHACTGARAAVCSRSLWRAGLAGQGRAATSWHGATAQRYGTALRHGAATAGDSTTHHKPFPPRSPSAGGWQQGCGVDVCRKPASASCTQNRRGTSHPIAFTEGACGNNFVKRYGNDCGYTPRPEQRH